ncbi:hypodermin-A-like isoform X1 [Aricia agestis]|uniref:hypodermin-A-like isoform X1 n=1 Tax=Aricia agestis TaxID=91739 RepID=UPI001C2094F1|nr:hypodermin-A-like isoform X1 [Aricia agestis]
MQKQLILSVVMLCAVVLCVCVLVSAKPEVDYTELANEAETNKNDILNFLNDTQIQQRYRNLYDILLKNLTGSTRRIVSGYNTSILYVPWQASLREKNYPICGASVLTDTWMLTAAHCLLRPNARDLTVRLGSSWRTHGGEMYDVKERHIHPRYVRPTKRYDVGLLRLHTRLRFCSRIMPIRVVERGSRLLADMPAIVSGWGKLREGGPSASFLQSSIMRTIAMKLCRVSGLDRNPIDPASMFCAGSFSQPSPDACQGDSGGPIVSNGVLIGIVSWGLGCARGNFPGVYTRVSNPVIHDWVFSKVANKSDVIATDVR